jgi:hypothetical protein
VCCGACCLCLLISIVCHKKHMRKNARRHRSLQNHTITSPTAPQELSTTDTSHTYHQSSTAMLKQAGAEPSAPPLEAAVTHAGEAPPAYHTVVRYKTIDLDTREDVRLSSTCTRTESASPPVYKEIL